MVIKLQFVKTVRWRLILWSTLVLFLTFAVFSAVVDRFVAHNLYDLIDSELLDTGGAFDTVLKRACQGGRSPTEAHLREEFDEMGLSTQIALRLDLAHIFERFYRGNRSSSPEADGSGLGLAIVKMIADLHAGRVTVNSESGKGSIFTLCIPKAIGPQPAGKDLP